METVLPSGITLQRRDEPSTLGPEYGVPLADHVLERIALRWAEQTGNPPATVVLSEDELGWTMWAPGHRAAYSTFVDKVTGRISGFANPAFPDRQYREQLEYDDGLVPRPGFRGPEVEPPALTAEVSLRRGPELLATGYGHSEKGAASPALHRLVQARLDTIPARARVRGCERHAEMIAFSVAAGRGGSLADDLPGPAIGGRLDDVQVTTKLHRIRDAGDPLINDPSPRSCTTCRQMLGEWPLPAPPTAWRLALDRRRVHHRPPIDPAPVIAEVVAISGAAHRHQPFPAAVEALRRYLGAFWTADVPGEVVRTTPFVVDPRAAAESADTLGRVAAAVGAPLFPLGTAGLEGILAIDPGHRVYLIDEAGEWHLGDVPGAALDTLMRGRTARRLP